MSLNPTWSISFKKRRFGHRHTQKKDHEMTQGEDGHLQAKERGLRRNQPCQHLDLRILPPELWENQFPLFKSPSLWYFVFAVLVNTPQIYPPKIHIHMDGPRDYHTEWSKSDRERKISYAIAYMWNLKRWYKWTYLQNRNRLTDFENKHGYQRGKVGRGIN